MKQRFEVCFIISVQVCFGGGVLHHTRYSSTFSGTGQPEYPEVSIRRRAVVSSRSEVRCPSSRRSLDSIHFIASDMSALGFFRFHSARCDCMGQSARKSLPRPTHSAPILNVGASEKGTCACCRCVQPIVSNHLINRCECL